MSKFGWRSILILVIALLVMVSVAGCVEETTDPELEVAELDTDPSVVFSEEEFNVSATITNTENETGDYEVVLEREGEVIETQTITLGPGEKTNISFHHQIAETGMYNLTIGDQSTEIRVVEEIESLSDIETLEFRMSFDGENETQFMLEDPATEDLKLKIDFVDQDFNFIINLESNIISITAGGTTFIEQIDFDEFGEIEDIDDLFEEPQNLFEVFFDFNDLPFDIDEFNGDLNETNENNELSNQTDFNETFMNETFNEGFMDSMDELLEEIFMAENPYQIEEISFEDPVTGMEIEIFDIKINEGFPEDTFVVYV